MTSDRPSKKQRELLNYLSEFISEQGYGPSYREVMRALDYKSVSTVAAHINGLVARGLLRKTDNSARSLEVIGTAVSSEASPHIQWLQRELAKREQAATEQAKREAVILGEALKILTPPPAA